MIPNIFETSQSSGLNTETAEESRADQLVLSMSDIGKFVCFLFSYCYLMSLYILSLVWSCFITCPVLSLPDMNCFVFVPVVSCDLSFLNPATIVL